MKKIIFSIFAAVSFICGIANAQTDVENLVSSAQFMQLMNDINDLGDQFLANYQKLPDFQQRQLQNLLNASGDAPTKVLQQISAIVDVDFFAQIDVLSREAQAVQNSGLWKRDFTADEIRDTYLNLMPGGGVTFSNGGSS